MGKSTKIAWADSTWNPWRGCEKVSSGCTHCYADTLAKRAGKDCRGPGAARLAMGDSYWEEPLAWNQQAAAGKVGKDGKHWIVFAGDMCDIFDDAGLSNERERMWNLIKKAPHLTWLLLSKRPQNFAKHLPSDWGEGYPNVWLGVTCENRTQGFPRVDILRKTPAKVRFLSCEPLLEDVSDVNLAGIDWLIVGGESGPGSRTFDLDCARSLKDRCAEVGTTFLFKQLGSKPVEYRSPFKILYKQLDGNRDPHGKAAINFPSDLQSQAWPDTESLVAVPQPLPAFTAGQKAAKTRKQNTEAKGHGDEVRITSGIHIVGSPNAQAVLYPKDLVHPPEELGPVVQWLDTWAHASGAIAFVAVVAIRSLGTLTQMLSDAWDHQAGRSSS